MMRLAVFGHLQNIRFVLAVLVQAEENVSRPAAMIIECRTRQIIDSNIRGYEEVIPPG